MFGFDGSWVEVLEKRGEQCVGNKSVHVCACDACVCVCMREGGKRDGN